MKLAVFFFVCSAILTGCEEEAALPQKNRTTLLTEFSWKLVGEYQRRVGALPTWGSNTYFPPECEADNQYIFTTAQQYSVIEGPSKCSPANPDIIFTDQWAPLQINSITIGNVKHVIERLDDNNLVLVFPRQLGGFDLEVKRIFIH
jgi:hypothetical protein